MQATKNFSEHSLLVNSTLVFAIAPVGERQKLDTFHGTKEIIGVLRGVGGASPSNRARPTRVSALRSF